MKLVIFGLIALMISSGMVSQSYAHTTVEVEQYAIEAGWGIEPPVVEINSDSKPGYYFSPIIPTKTGSYLVDLKGEIRGVAVDIQIPVEDVESTAILDFPPKASEGSADVSALKNAISSLQQDISKLKSGETTTTSDGGAAYDFAIFGLSIAAAAIILAIIALVKRK